MLIPGGHTDPQKPPQLMSCPLPSCEVREWRTFSEEHHAIDLDAAVGTPVYAADNGTVYRAGWNFSTEPPALAVTILHTEDGSIATNYWHLDEVYVEKGDRVAKGQIIGRVGMTGTTSWPHLHFSVQVDRVHVDPEIFIDYFVKTRA